MLLFIGRQKEFDTLTNHKQLAKITSFLMVFLTSIAKAFSNSESASKWEPGRPSHRAQGDVSVRQRQLEKKLGVTPALSPTPSQTWPQVNPRSRRSQVSMGLGRLVLLRTQVQALALWESSKLHLRLPPLLRPSASPRVLNSCKNAQLP